MASDNDNGKDDDDDDANSKDELVEISTGEAPTMLDSLANLKYLSKEERNSCRECWTKSKVISMIILYVEKKFVW